jgi:L-methionine (R)-S-oxide reductase
MRERSADRPDLSKLRAEVETLVSSDAPDERVIAEVVRLAHDAHPLWDWSGIYLLVDGTLVVGPFAGSDEPPEHSRIEVGYGVCGTAVAEDKNQLVEDVRELDNYLACSLSTRSELVVLIREGVESSASSTSTATSWGPLRKKTRFCWKRSRP